MSKLFTFAFSSLLFVSQIFVASGQSFSSAEALASGPDSYLLTARDLVVFSVLNEPETLSEQRIDGEGRIRVPYLGPVKISGLTVRQAERGLEKAYLEHEIYLMPQVTLRVAEYTEREVAVLGEVANPGNIEFPIEANNLDIREAISRAGGFTNVARSSQVIVTRQTDSGKVNYKVNVEDMLREGEGESSPTFRVLPDDVIFVPERFF